jgi:hypothetical protein
MKQTATLERISPRQDVLWTTLGLVGVMAALLLTLSTGLLARSPDVDSADGQRLQQTIAGALGEDARVTLTGWGDLWVEFALREASNARTNTDQALADTLTIARAVYTGSEPRPATITVVGLASGVPVLYASLPADRLIGLDWSRLQPQDLPRVAGVRWLSGGMCQAWHECPPGGL